ncbi:MAG: DUF2809 domain-containing protein [Deltaproteobacteria bacterium]|nr:DUF2809 domain-containing protein [Deltaproteobacteria bacterium]
MKRRDVVLAALAAGLGLATLLYHGPGRWFFRGHVGDVAATMFVLAVLGVTRWTLRTRALVTLGIATAIELGQNVWSGGLILGSVFDPWDLAAYLVGVIIGVTYHLAHDVPLPDARPLR